MYVVLKYHRKPTIAEKWKDNLTFKTFRIENRRFRAET